MFCYLLFLDTWVDFEPLCIPCRALKTALNLAPLIVLEIWKGRVLSNTAWTWCCYQENGGNWDEMWDGGEFRGAALCTVMGRGISSGSGQIVSFCSEQPLNELPSPGCREINLPLLTSTWETSTILLPSNVCI